MRRRLLLASVSLLLSLGAVEGICRVTGYGSPVSGEDVQMAWEPEAPFLVRQGGGVPVVLQPSWRGRQVYRSTVTGQEVRAVEVRTSSAGLRGPDLDLPPTRYRVLLLGDSVTFGQGVEEHQAFPAIYGQALGQAVEAVNGGVPSWDLAPEVAWLESDGWSLEPRHVVLCFYVNDVSRAPRTNAADQARPIPHTAPPWATREAGLRRFSYALNAVFRLVSRERLAREMVPQASWRGGSYLDELRRDFSAVEVRGAMARLKSTCDAHGVPCTVALLPVLVGGSQDDGSDLLDRVAAEVRDVGLPLVRVDDALKDLPPWDRYVLPADRHPGPAAHAAIGRTLAARLPLPFGE